MVVGLQGVILKETSVSTLIRDRLISERTFSQRKLDICGDCIEWLLENIKQDADPHHVQECINVLAVIRGEHK